VSAAPTVVFGDDGSPSSDVAFSWIDHQAWPGWRLHVLHAEAPPYGKPVPADEARPHPWDAPHPRQPSSGAAFAEVTHLLARADPRVALLEPTDLLVVGPRGRGRLKALNLGSVAEWMLMHPPNPTVIARTPDPVRQVLVAHDGSAAADLAVQTLASLPWVTDATCTIIVVDDGRVHVDSAIDAARSALRAAGVDADVVTDHGPPTAALMGEIDRRRPQLAVLGTRGLTGMRRFHLGSTASAVARSAPCSVLVACAARGEDPLGGAG
jgi:nucleotide-binding universal stress UspA family protein